MWVGGNEGKWIRGVRRVGINGLKMKVLRSTVMAILHYARTHHQHVQSKQ